MLTKAKPYSKTTAHGYYLSTGLFRPKCEQDNAQTIELHHRGDADDDRAGDDVRHRTLERARGELPERAETICEDAAVGVNELAIRASPSAASRTRVCAGRG